MSRTGASTPEATNTAAAASSRACSLRRASARFRGNVRAAGPVLSGTVHTGILAGNYGEGGALNLYGPALGLPHAMSLTNSFWYRGYDPRLPQTVILTGFRLEEGRKLFDSCIVAAKNTNPFGVENEESRDHPDILVCRNLRMPWPIYWARSRRFG